MTTKKTVVCAALALATTAALYAQFAMAAGKAPKRGTTASGRTNVKYGLASGADQVLSAVYDSNTNSLRVEGGGGSSVSVQTNGVANGVQSVLNLVNGANIALTNAAGTGNVSVSFIGILPSSLSATAHTWLSSYNAATGAFTATQPSFLDLSGTLSTAQLPAGALTFSGTIVAGDCAKWSSSGVLADAGAVCGSGSGSITLAGDLSGTTTSQTVVGIQNHFVSSAAPNSGQVLEWNTAADAWTPTSLPAFGTVTSVGLSLPSSLFTVSNSPVTTSGTLTGALASQNANTVFAGPSSGAAAAPMFRALTATDIPALNYQAPLSSYVAPANEFLTGFTPPGTFTAAQPSFANLSGTATLGQLPATLAQFTGTITANDCAKWGSSGVLTDAGAPCGSGGSGAPGGANTQIQFNNNGAFGASGNFTWNNTNQALAESGTLTVAGLPNPAAPTLSTGGTTGTTSYSYAIVAEQGSATTAEGPAATIATGNATLSATNYNVITTPSVTGSTACDVYRTASSGSPLTIGKIGSVTCGSALNDTGLAASGSAPTSNFTGVITAQGFQVSGASTAGCLTLNELPSNGSYSLQLCSPASVASDVTWTLPTADGTNGQVLSTNGSGALSWVTPSGGGGFTAAGDLSGTSTSQNVVGLHFGSTGLALGAAPTSGQCLEYNGTNITGGACSGGAGGSSVWSSLTSPTASLTLSNAGYNTTYNQTSAANWTWANTTAATSATPQDSPVLNLNGTSWTGAGASTVDGYSLQAVPNSGLNATSSLLINRTTSAPGTYIGIELGPNGPLFYNPGGGEARIASTANNVVLATGNSSGIVVEPNSTEAAEFDMNLLKMTSASIEHAVANVTFSTTPSLNFANGDVQQFACTTAGAAISPTVTGQLAGEILTFVFVQNGATACTLTWPSNIHNGMTVSSALNSVSTQQFVVNAAGTDLYALSAGVSNGGGGLPASWSVSAQNTVLGKPLSGQDAVALQLEPNVASPAADVFQVYESGATPTTTCATNAKCAFAVQANGDVYLLGNALTLGQANQSTASSLSLFGGLPNQAYIKLGSGSLNAPAQPSIALASGGSLPASTTYTVEVTYTNSAGETTVSAASASVTTSSTCTASGSCEIVVTSPSAESGAVDYNVYASSGGAYAKATSTAVAIGTNYTITSAPSGSAPPSANTTGDAINDYLSMSASAAGVACVSSSAPGADCASGTWLTTQATLTPTPGNCVKWTGPNQIGDQGAPCGSAAPSLGALFVNPIDASGGVPASATQYAGISGSANSLVNQENMIEVPVPAACTAQNFYVFTTAAQSSTGALTFTLRQNGANTTLAVTLAASAAAGKYSNTTNTVSLNAGDLVDVQVANAATAASAPFSGFSFQCK